MAGIIGFARRREDTKVKQVQGDGWGNG